MQYKPRVSNTSPFTVGLSVTKIGRYLAGRIDVFTVAGPLQQKDSLLRNEQDAHFTYFQTIQFR